MPPKRNALNDDRVPSHGSKFLRKMDEFRAAGILCDVTLESKDGRSFAVHKVVLAAFSPYFQAMFANDMRESKEDKVKLDVDGKILSEVIRFAYTSQLTLSKTMKNIKAALIVANMLLLEDVEKICVESIIEGLNMSNCVEFIELAEYLSCEMLSQNVLQYLEKNFADVAAHEGKSCLLGGFSGGFSFHMGYLPPSLPSPPPPPPPPPPPFPHTSPHPVLPPTPLSFPCFLTEQKYISINIIDRKSLFFTSLQYCYKRKITSRFFTFSPQRVPVLTSEVFGKTAGLRRHQDALW